MFNQNYYNRYFFNFVPNICITKSNKIDIYKYKKMFSCLFTTLTTKFTLYYDKIYTLFNKYIF